MQFIRNHLLATAFAGVALLVLTGWMVLSFQGADSAKPEANWEKVKIFHDPRLVKNLTQIGTVSVSISLPTTNFNSDSLRQAALAKIKQEAAHANASAVLLQTDQESFTPHAGILLIGHEYQTRHPLNTLASFIRQVRQDPHNYTSFLLLLSAVVLLWAALCLCGLISLLTSLRRRKLFWAIPALLFGFIGLLTQIPVHLQAEGESLHFNCRWLFLLPLLLGILGLASRRTASPQTAV